MTAVGVIPARWASSRFPGKMLAKIAGKPMLQHVWERARRASKLEDVIIACDEQHVLDAVKAFGARAVMTSPKHPSGSDRVAEAAGSSQAEIVVNIQGDEPFIEPDLIDALVSSLEYDSVPVMATAIKRFSSREDFLNPNMVKVVVDKDGNALYFSRSPIPFRRDGWPENFSRYFRHLGIYAYRRQFLLDMCQWPKSFLEQEESLEQLRVLENGAKIKTVETEFETIGVDTPADLVRAEAYYADQNR